MISQDYDHEACCAFMESIKEIPVGELFKVDEQRYCRTRIQLSDGCSLREPQENEVFCIDTGDQIHTSCLYGGEVVRNEQRV